MTSAAVVEAEGQEATAVMLTVVGSWGAAVLAELSLSWCMMLAMASSVSCLLAGTDLGREEERERE